MNIRVSALLNEKVLKGYFWHADVWGTPTSETVELRKMPYPSTMDGEDLEGARVLH